jgi:hypothetical protein
MSDLFAKYEQIMSYHHTELVDEVFTKKFLKDNGGKDEFIEKVKDLPLKKEKKGLGKLLDQWKKSKMKNMFFAKIKSRSSSHHETNFIVVEEDGKLKIDGTVSDGE